MLNTNLTVVDNGSVTNVGNQGSKIYALVASALSGAVKRRIAATATTKQEELDTSHSQSGKGYSMRYRSLVKASYTALDTDTTTTGGIIPSASFYSVLDRPANMGSIITAQVCKNLVGAVIGVLVASGQLDALLNLES